MTATRQGALSAVVADERDLPALLDRGLEGLGLPLPPAARQQLLRHVALLARWNRTYNLTAIREPERMVTHHLLDSLAVVPALDRVAAGRSALSVLDVGSGGGLPGIPIAVARPEWRVTMVDPVQKKGAFLVQAIAELGLGNARAATVRAEDLPTTAPFDIVISRAFADLAAFAQAALRHVARDGRLVAMKGVHPDAELAELPPSVDVEETLVLAVPFVEGARHLVVMRHRT
jgi:16S rRNA (guanine527-N7)-methyltransferase